MPSPDPSAGPFPTGSTVNFAQIIERAAQFDLGQEPHEMRRRFEALYLGDAADQASELPSTQLGQRRAVLIGVDSAEQLNGPVWLWLHGGGYVFGSTRTHERAATALSAISGQPVALLDYRLAPEHRWPAQLEDATAAARELISKGCRVGLIGDSAGGHLAINAALQLASTGEDAACLALLSPNTDRSGLNATRSTRNDMDPIVDSSFDELLAELCFHGQLSDTDPQVSPALARLDKLPPTHVEVGGRELLRDDAAAFYALAREQGAQISLHEELEAIHMWQMWTPYLPEAAESLRRVSERLSPAILA